MYSDEWLRKGYVSGKRIRINDGEPINYRIWYDGDKEIGACIDFEFADDAHFEFVWNEFEKLVKLWGGEECFVQNMQSFFQGQKTYFSFEELLENNNIEFNKIVFY